MRRFFLLLAVCCAISTSAAAHDYMLGDIHILKPWSRPLPAVSVNGAAYMTLMNKGDSPDKLLSVSTPAAKKAEVHNHIIEVGLMDDVAFPLGFGDENDFCLRAPSLGYELKVVEGVYVWHHKSKS